MSTPYLDDVLTLVFPSRMRRWCVDEKRGSRCCRTRERPTVRTEGISELHDCVQEAEGPSRRPEFKESERKPIREPLAPNERDNARLGHHPAVRLGRMSGVQYIQGSIGRRSPPG